MKALLIIDVQNDFCPGGSLEVENGDSIISIINSLSPEFKAVVCTQDWHPADHSSFASNHADKSPYDTWEADYGTQVLWPDHCIQGSEGADINPDLNTHNSDLIIRKGFRKNIDSYSAFFENDQKTKTGLYGYLQDRNVEEVYVCGLATDFCVKWTVLDALKLNFKTTLIKDATKGIDIDGSLAEAMSEMEEAGAFMENSAELQ